MTRKLFSITGADAESFLQNLVTNDVARARNGLVWTGLLTPQGKYLADFFLSPFEGGFLLDVAEPFAAGLIQRLTMYKLRADVTLSPVDLDVAQGLGALPEGAFADPRDPALGWRAYGRSGAIQGWEALRISLGVPESGAELIPNDTFILEAGFERFHGVDFKKGCYVGQEVTARMKHKTELRKGLCRVAIEGAAAPGTEVINVAGKVAGRLCSQAEGQALAHLRFDRVDGPLTAGDAVLTLIEKL
ncbi:MAG: folate-binding protein [Silicimonas sp.]|nr:folate-binding protein [Silicimonas sp.]